MMVQPRESQCKFYGFMDDELPSDYYKELFFKEHEELKMLRWRVEELLRGNGEVHMEKTVGAKYVEGKSSTFEEATYLQMVEMKAEMKEELSLIKAKLNSHDKVVVLFGLFVLLMLFVYASNVIA